MTPTRTALAAVALAFLAQSSSAAPVEEAGQPPFPPDAFLGPAPWLDPLAPPPEVTFGGPKAVSPVPALATTSQVAVKVAYKTYYDLSMPAVGFTGSTATCTPGGISLAFKEWTATRINFIRAMAGVPSSTTINAAQEPDEQAAALIMAANNTITHSPPNTYLCYTSAGATASGQSNLAYGVVDSIPLYMSDPGTGNEAAGHRRWILHSGKQSFAMGQAVNGATHYNALYAFANIGASTATPNGITWPPRGYAPMALFPTPFGGEGQRWSFGYPGANFGAATVAVTLNGSPVAVVPQAVVNGYGDNTFVWSLPVSHVVTKGSVYDITVSGITGTGVPASFNYQVRPFDPADPAWEVRGDSNGDSKSDLFWRDASGGLSWWQMNGNAIASSNFFSVGTEWSVVDVGDLNGDGRADLIWRRASDGATYLWTLNGPAISGYADLGIVGPEWSLVGSADFDGDGRSDILWRKSDGTVYVWLMNGGAIVGQGVVGAVGNSWQIQDLADFDGDGKADILWRNTDGTVYLWFMNGAALKGQGTVGLLDPVAWTFAGTGDFNGDRRADILWRSPGGELYQWFMNANAISAQASLGNPGAAWSVASVADFSGDTRADILLRHTSGSHYLWMMNGSTIASGGAVPAPGGTWQIVAP